MLVVQVLWNFDSEFILDLDYDILVEYVHLSLVD